MQLPDKHYVLMHKNYEVLTFRMNDDNEIIKVDEVLAKDHIPLNMQLAANQEIALYDFISNRSIPKERKNLSHILRVYDAYDAVDLSLQSYQVSISDHYWVKETDDDTTWDEINFYTNHFMEDAIFIGANSLRHMSGMTPNSSINGSLPQMWIQHDGNIYLLKGGDTVLGLQPFNEVYVSSILAYTDFHHVTYELTHMEGVGAVSSCEAFTNERWEYIPAWHVAKKIRRSENKYKAFIEQAQQQGILNVQEDLDTILAIDFLTLNDDRHYGNFGFIRDSETLEFKGMAPIFDNGNTMWYNELTINPHKPTYAYPALPFTTNHDKQIKYVRTDVLSRIQVDAMREAVIRCIDEVYGTKDTVSPERLDRMKIMMRERFDLLITALQKGR